MHAAGESSPGDLANGTYAVVLAVPDEAALQQLADELYVNAVPHVVIVETDGPHAGQAMAIGLRPGRKEVLRRSLSSLPLLR